MNKFVVIRYRDALYYTSKKINHRGFPIHIAIGQIIKSGEYLVLCFTKKDNQPEEGLFIPKKALILDKKEYSILPAIENLKEGLKIGLYWKDIVHFVNGELPSECTPMYTEGILFSIIKDALIIQNPETVMLGKNIHNHPKENATFIVLPKLFITNIQIYDR